VVEEGRAARPDMDLSIDDFHEVLPPPSGDWRWN
jgi:hypothetical protein